jgi:hypothetical protein
MERRTVDTVGIIDELLHVLEPLAHERGKLGIDDDDGAARIGRRGEVEHLQRMTRGNDIAGCAGIDDGVLRQQRPRQYAHIVEQRIEGGIGETKQPQQRLDERLLQFIESEIVGSRRRRSGDDSRRCWVRHGRRSFPARRPHFTPF